MLGLSPVPESSFFHDESRISSAGVYEQTQVPPLLRSHTPQRRGRRAGFEYVGGGLYLPATLLSKSAQPWAVQWD